MDERWQRIAYFAGSKIKFPILSNRKQKNSITNLSVEDQTKMVRYPNSLSLQLVIDYDAETKELVRLRFRKLN